MQTNLKVIPREKTLGEGRYDRRKGNKRRANSPMHLVGSEHTILIGR